MTVDFVTESEEIRTIGRNDDMEEEVGIIIAYIVSNLFSLLYGFAWGRESNK